MASRQNSSQMLNSQSSSSNSTTSSGKEKTQHGVTKSDTKSKHDKGTGSGSGSVSGHIPMSSNTIINSMNNMSKRKGTSFQITSVSETPQQQQQQLQHRTDNNNDYETPSFSEDTSFSRDDVFFAQPNAFGTAPVIPTSSQYGLAIVGPDLGGNGGNLTDVHVSVSDAGINIMGQIPSKQDVDHKNERFKVVKIESTEPFKRGRWMCMDYLDHTTLQAQDDGIDGTAKDEDPTKTKDDSEMDGNDEQEHGMDHDNDGFDQEVMRAEMSHPTSHVHAQTMPQKQLEQMIDTENSRNNTENTDQHGQTLPSSILRQNLGLETSASSIQSPIPVPSETLEPAVQDSVTNQFGTGDKQQQNTESEQPASGSTATNDNLISNSSVSDNNNNDGTQNTSSPSSSAGLGTVAEGGENATAAAAPDDALNEDSESASGTSAVAIDNKIEQAMDLVKSHLMFAVREEVEVLKEKINELMDRINQLEVENTILKANASQETLSQLSTAATIAVSPQAPVQTSPAQQPQSSPALSKINIDASVLQAAANITNSQIQQPPQNPPPVQQQNPSTAS